MLNAFLTTLVCFVYIFIRHLMTIKTFFFINLFHHLHPPSHPPASDSRSSFHFTSFYVLSLIKGGKNLWKPEGDVRAPGFPNEPVDTPGSFRVQKSCKGGFEIVRVKPDSSLINKERVDGTRQSLDFNAVYCFISGFC